MVFHSPLKPIITCLALPSLFVAQAFQEFSELLRSRMTRVGFPYKLLKIGIEIQVFLPRGWLKKL
ncbi:MAG: hypothetical protein AAGA80_15500 [Cyanobacteria bacterium P01_F01_bin.143]